MSRGCWGGSWREIELAGGVVGVLGEGFGGGRFCAEKKLGVCGQLRGWRGFVG